MTSRATHATDNANASAQPTVIAPTQQAIATAITSHPNDVTTEHASKT